MTPESQRIAIAKVCGADKFFVLKKRGLYYRPEAAGYTDRIEEAWKVTEDIARKHEYPHDEPVTKHPAPLPDYLNDLNAMREAWLWMTSHDNRECDNTAAFECHLREIIARDNKVKLTWPFLQSYTINATAAQRAEAFLKTVNLWDDSK